MSGGIRLMSALAMRWPLTRTSERLMPKPRSETRDAPPPASSKGLATPPPLLLFEGLVALPERSEEHTSELQSLMRISYAVFCLKKKTTHTLRQYYTAHLR